jgi:hypothetical protein
VRRLVRISKPQLSRLGLERIRPVFEPAHLRPREAQDEFGRSAAGAGILDANGFTQPVGVAAPLV